MAGGGGCGGSGDCWAALPNEVRRRADGTALRIKYEEATRAKHHVSLLGVSAARRGDVSASMGVWSALPKFEVDVAGLATRQRPIRVSPN